MATESYPVDGLVPSDPELVHPHSGASMQRHFMTASIAEYVGLYLVAGPATS